MNFRKVTRPRINNKQIPTYVNMDLIKYIVEEDDGCMIYFTDGSDMYVKESLKDLFDHVTYAKAVGRILNENA